VGLIGIFTRDPDGHPTLVTSGDKRRRSEHGLGHLLPPYARRPDEKDPDWLDEWWQHLLCVETGYPSTPPAWFAQPAVGRLTITSPRDLAPWKRYNATRDRAHQVKPANFLMLAHPHAHERARRDGARTLIAPFELDPQRRLQLGWLDRTQPDHPPRRIRTDHPHETRDDSIAVLSYGDHFDNYRLHPETKALDPTDDERCHRWTRGLLNPWHIIATKLNRIGKESNRLADDPQPVDGEDQPIIEYPAPGRKCRGCDAVVTGRRRWCSDACRKRSSRAAVDAMAESVRPGTW
jgi:hypothetical protein